MAQSATEMAQIRSDLTLLPQCPITAAVWTRAFDVFELLAKPEAKGHRRVKPADLVIAAAAEAAGVGLLHYDQDYDAIAAVTGQPTRWVAERGSL